MSTSRSEALNLKVSPSITRTTCASNSEGSFISRGAAKAVLVKNTATKENDNIIRENLFLFKVMI